MADPGTQSPLAEPGAGRRARWPWVLLGTVFFLTALVFALPYGLRAGVEYALRGLGAEQARLDEVELSLWRGELGLRGLYVEDQGHPPLVLDHLLVRIGYKPLWSRRIVVEDVQVSGLRAVLDMHGDGMPHIGIRIPEPSPATVEEKPVEPGARWHFAIDQLALSGIDFRAMIPDFDAHWQLETLQFSGLASWLPEQGSPLKVRSVFNGARLDLDGSSQVLGETHATRLNLRLAGLPLAGVQGFVREQLPVLTGSLGLDLEIALQLDGNALRVEPVGSIELAGLALRDAEGREVGLNFQWNGAMGVDLDTASGDTALQLDGKAQLGQLRLELKPEQLGLQNESLAWQGKTAVMIGKSGVGVDTAGALDLADLKLDLRAQKIRVDAGKLGWNGDVKVVPTSDAPEIAATGEVSLAALQVIDRAHRLRLAELASGSVAGVQFNGPQAIQVAQVQLGRVRALALAEDPAQRMVAFDAVRLDSITLDDDGVRIAGISLSGGRTRLLRQQDGQLAFLERLGGGTATAGATAGAAPAADAAAPGSAAPGARDSGMRIRIGQLSFGSPHLVEFRDDSAAPAYAQNMQINTLTVSNIDTVSRSASSDLVLAAAIGEFGRLDLNGTLTPLVDPDNGEIKLDIQAVELPGLTPYAVQVIGYELNRGQLNIDTEVSLVDRELDGRNSIFVRGLELTKKDASRAEAFAASISMPLNSALSLLRDGDGNIELEVPIAGRIDAPDISIQDVINKALGTALRKAALSYVKYAIQPYGALIMLAEAASDAGQRAAMGLQPVLFQPGLADPGQVGRDYLEKLSGLLKERPEITLKLCGVSVPSDRTVLDTQPAFADGPDLAEAPEDISMADRLRALAERRVSAVKGVLVNEQGVNAGRLLSCNPKLSDDAEAKPEVQINI